MATVYYLLHTAMYSSKKIGSSYHHSFDGALISLFFFFFFSDLWVTLLSWGYHTTMFHWVALKLVLYFLGWLFCSSTSNFRLREWNIQHVPCLPDLFAWTHPLKWKRQTLVLLYGSRSSVYIETARDHTRCANLVIENASELQKSTSIPIFDCIRCQNLFSTSRLLEFFRMKSAV